MVRPKPVTFDKVKIDRAFVSRITSDRASGHIVRAIIAMCDGLELEVVAEGIELSEQWTSLRDLGCEFGQGFFFARPMDGDAVLEHLASRAGDGAVAGDAP